MFKRLTNVIFLVASFLIFCSFSVDEDPFAELLKKLAEFAKKYPQEKVHLHLDKPYYGVGDDIWFKAYVVDARTGEPTANSNILYVDLINERDTVQQQLKLPMQNGVTWGDFKLPDTLNEGNYRLRAYTQLMRNASPKFFFDKTIKIGKTWNNTIDVKTNFNSIQQNGKTQNKANILFTANDLKVLEGKTVVYEIWDAGIKIAKDRIKIDDKGRIDILLPNVKRIGSKIVATIDLGASGKAIKTIPIIIDDEIIDVQFFPEGGYLVQGLASKIAIKAIDANGIGKDINGKVIDENGAEVASFNTSYLGMGSFFLNPVSGKTYTAKYKLANGSEKSIALPKPQNTGYLLSALTADPKNINIKVLLSPEMLNKGELNLVAHKNGIIKLATKIPTDKQLIKITINKSELPSGIIQLTLFSPDKIPVAERIVFVKNSADQIDINLSELKANYKKRENVALSITGKVNQKIALANFSVAVTDASVGADIENETNIFTDLLLKGDLIGNIEKPNYYFLSDDQQTNERLDNLMLTQGWRRIDWNSIKSDTNTPSSFPAENSLVISGNITKGNKVLPKSKITLMSNKGGLFTMNTISDENGKFIFQDLVFADSTKFLVQARSEKDKKEVKINLDVSPQQQIDYSQNNIDVDVNVNEFLGDYLTQNRKYIEEQVKNGLLKSTIMLKEVKIETSRPNPAKNSVNFNGPGNADEVFDGNDLLRYTAIDQYLVGRIAGVTIRRGQAYNLRNGGVMAIMMDGMFMGSEYSLLDVNPMEVESIEILRSVSKIAIYGPEAGNGIIFITTRRGRPIPNQLIYAPGLTTYFPKGYYNARSFYSPKYDTNEELKPDLRTTVFWEPQLLSNESGEVKFNYFNTDNIGIYRIVIEGIDALGNLARKVYTYEVK